MEETVSQLQHYCHSVLGNPSEVTAVIFCLAGYVAAPLASTIRCQKQPHSPDIANVPGGKNLPWVRTTLPEEGIFIYLVLINT